MKAVREEEVFRTYTADSLYFITNYCGVRGWKRYSDIVYPKPEDNRSPQEIARERAEKMGLKVVK